MEDNHLGTGKYNPKKYWEERARRSQGDVYRAVCVFNCTKEENSAMEHMQKYIFRSLIKKINLQNMKILEIGCGLGRWAPFILKRDGIYYGIDISESMLRLAKSKVPEASFCLVDSDKLPFSDKEFDMVFSITVLHHNPYPEQSKIINELLRVTKPGGYLIFIEGIYPIREQISFNMFPRPLEDWVEEITYNGRATILKVKIAHWWILRDFTFRFMQICGIRGANRENMKRVNKLLVYCGRIFDKYLNYFLPKRFATNAGMLFKKKEVLE